MRLEFHPAARLELVEAIGRYELQVPGLGERFAAEVQRVGDLLSLHPHIGRLIENGLRRFPLRGFPFNLIYSSYPDVLRIEAVAHQRRRSGYWRSRVNR